MNIHAKAEDYRQSLEDFIVSKDIPRHFFDHQDHLAFKAFSAKSYEDLLKQFDPLTVEASESWMDDRRIAVARLAVKESIGMKMSFSLNASRIYLVEIMEVKPDGQSDDPPILDHEEVYFHNLGAVEEALNDRGVRYEPQFNNSHAWLSVLIGNGHELKFTNDRLENIVEKEIARGDNVKILKEA